MRPRYGAATNWHGVLGYCFGEAFGDVGMTCSKVEKRYDGAMEVFDILLLLTLPAFCIRLASFRVRLC